jgi:hypothetical protein
MGIASDGVTFTPDPSDLAAARGSTSRRPGDPQRDRHRHWVEGALLIDRAGQGA